MRYVILSPLARKIIFKRKKYSKTASDTQFKSLNYPFLHKYRLILASVMGKPSRGYKRRKGYWRMKQVS
jgi:hypothetical protein